MRQVLRDVLGAAATVAHTPGVGHRRAEIRRPDLRVWIVHAYLIVYRWDVDPIEIVRIVHGARDPDELGRGL